jgi:isoamylase
MMCFGMLMDGRAQRTGIQKQGDDATLLLVINGHHDLVEFTLPSSYGGNQWALLVDTNLQNDEAQGVHETGESYAVTGRSVLLFRVEVAKCAERRLLIND